MDKSNIIQFFGATWCRDCARSKDLLDEKKVDYKFINIDEDKRAASYVERINDGYRSIPTIIFPNGDKLIEPTNEELIENLCKNQLIEC